MRILLFGDGAWAANSLEELLKSGHTVVGVAIRARPSGSDLERSAKHHNIRVIQPPRINDAQTAETIKGLQPELGISIAYDQIFQPAIYDFLPAGLINFHAGKLPFYRGRNVVNWAILNGETEIGLTSHFVDSSIDTGPIILQKTFPIGWTDGYGDVLSRVISGFPAFVCETVAALAGGQHRCECQNPEQGSYFPGRGPEDEWLDWNDISFNLHNKVRAITRPGPGARTLWGDVEVRIWRAYYDTTWTPYISTPGVVVGRSESGALVKTRDSVLLVQEIQLPGNEPEKPRWRLGTRLGLDVRLTLKALEAKCKDLEQLLRHEGSTLSQS